MESEDNNLHHEHHADAEHHQGHWLVYLMSMIALYACVSVYTFVCVCVCVCGGGGHVQG